MNLLRNMMARGRVPFGHSGGISSPFPAFTVAEQAAQPNKWMHLRAQDIALADNAVIVTWPDSGPGSRNGTGSGSPVFRTNQLNGFPAVQLSGSNYFTFGAQTMANSSVAIWCVCTPGAGVGQKNFFRNNTTPTNLSLTVQSNLARFFVNGSQFDTVNAGALAAATPMLLTSRVMSGGQVYGGMTGRTEYNNSTSGYAGFTANSPLVGFGHDDKIYELLIISPAPDKATCNRWDKTFEEKYGLTLTRPTLPGWVCAGDSQTDAAAASHVGNAWPSLFQALAGGSGIVNVTNRGTSGYTATNLYGARGAYQSDYHPFRTYNGLAYCIGINDLNTSPGATGEGTAKAQSQLIYTSAKSSGFDYVARMPITNLNPAAAGAEASRIVVENHAIANPGLYGDTGLVLPWSSANAGIFGSTRDGSSWFDTLHLNPSGESLFAADFIAMLRAAGLIAG